MATKAVQQPTTYYYRYDTKNAPQPLLVRFDPLSVALMEAQPDSYLEYYGYQFAEEANELMTIYQNHGQAVDEFFLLIRVSQGTEAYRLVVHVSDTVSLTEFRRVYAPDLYQLRQILSKPGVLPPPRSNPNMNTETFTISHQLARVMAGG